MTTNRQQAAAKLFKNKMARFGIAADVADELVRTGRVSMPHRRGDTPEFYQLRPQAGDTMLGLAEHAARCLTNWARPYHVDTTRLAMSARG